MAKKTSAKKRAPKVDTDTVLTPLGGGVLCYCGCGLLADGVGWDDGAPLSFRCCFNKAVEARDAKVAAEAEAAAKAAAEAKAAAKAAAKAEARAARVSEA
jgi:hypothetical protein